MASAATAAAPPASAAAPSPQPVERCNRFCVHTMWGRTLNKKDHFCVHAAPAGGGALHQLVRGAQDLGLPPGGVLQKVRAAGCGWEQGRLRTGPVTHTLHAGQRAGRGVTVGRGSRRGGDRRKGGRGGRRGTSRRRRSSRDNLTTAPTAKRDRSAAALPAAPQPPGGGPVPAQPARAPVSPSAAAEPAALAAAPCEWVRAAPGARPRHMPAGQQLATAHRRRPGLRCAPPAGLAVGPLARAPQACHPEASGSQRARARPPPAAPRSPTRPAWPTPPARATSRPRRWPAPTGAPSPRSRSSPG